MKVDRYGFSKDFLCKPKDQGRHETYGTVLTEENRNQIVLEALQKNLLSLVLGIRNPAPRWQNYTCDAFLEAYDRLKTLASASGRYEGCKDSAELR